MATEITATQREEFHRYLLQDDPDYASGWLQHWVVDFWVPCFGDEVGTVVSGPNFDLTLTEVEKDDTWIRRGFETTMESGESIEIYVEHIGAEFNDFEFSCSDEDIEDMDDHQHHQYGDDELDHHDEWRRDLCSFCWDASLFSTMLERSTALKQAFARFSAKA